MFSEKLYTLRKNKDLSQKELAALLGVTNKAISKWETGAAFPKTETVIKLAEIFGISADELLSATNDAKNKPEISIREKEPARFKIKSFALTLVWAVLVLVISLFSTFLFYEQPDNVKGLEENICAFSIDGDLLVFYKSQHKGYCATFFEDDNAKDYKSVITANRITSENVYEMKISDENLMIRFAIFDKSYEIPEREVIMQDFFYEGDTKRYFCILGANKGDFNFNHITKYSKDKYYTFFITPTITDVGEYYK